MNDKCDRLLTPVSHSDHIRKSGNCSVVLVEYGDYQCPHSGTAHRTIRALQQQFEHQICFVFRHFPQVQKYPQAQKASEAAEAAGAQGFFWQMHDVLFEYQHALDDSSLVQYANDLKLDIPRFLRDMSGHLYTPRVERDIKSAHYNGIYQTPALFINDMRYRHDWAFETLQSAIVEIGQFQ